MKALRLLFGIGFLLSTAVALAQNDVEEWLMNGRPDCQWAASQVDGQHRAPRRIGSQATAPLKARGVQRVPVVLAAFQDIKFSAAETDSAVNAFYHRFCNGLDNGQLYTGHGSHGSIRDYFIEQSDSVFRPEFTIIGPVVLDSMASFYGRRSGNTNDVNSTKFYNEATAKAMEVYEDWDRFDNDHNGTIDMIFFIFAGLGENNTNGKYPNLLWPKETTRSTTINGRVFATSALTCEARPKKWNEDRTEVLETQTDGVGVFIHELSHALGLPDFYDTKYKAFGMDLWSVMDYGEYAGNGYNPGNYTAYERDFMGWRPLKKLEEPCVLTISCFADGGYGYKIQNDSSVNEYYIIENRQPRGWDDQVGLAGHGLQVTHVDYDASRWNANAVNTDADHQRMTIIAANNNYNGTNTSGITKSAWMAMLAGNLYPGDTFNYNLTDESVPAATVYVGGLMHKPIRNITENEDGTVTICFRTNGQLETPELYEAENIQMDQFDARWATVDNATRYAFELYKDSTVIRCDTVADPEFHFDNLLPSSNLKLRVKAMADTPEDYVDSEWSDFVYLSTLADFIDSVADGEKWVDVYALNGTCVGHCHADELGGLGLHRGVYILRYANGAARKILIQ